MLETCHRVLYLSRSQEPPDPMTLAWALGIVVDTDGSKGDTVLQLWMLQWREAPGVGFEPTRPKGPTAYLVQLVVISRFHAQRTEAHRLCRRTWLGNPGYGAGCVPRINVVLWRRSSSPLPQAKV